MPASNYQTAYLPKDQATYKDHLWVLWAAQLISDFPFFVPVISWVSFINTSQCKLLICGMMTLAPILCFVSKFQAEETCSDMESACSARPRWRIALYCTETQPLHCQSSTDAIHSLLEHQPGKELCRCRIV